MNLIYENEQSFPDFVENNEARFKESLLACSKEFLANIDHNPTYDRDRIFESGKLLVRELHSHDIDELKQLAKKRGQSLAEHDFGLNFVMEFFSQFRKTYWDFYDVYAQFKDTAVQQTETNYLLDQVINQYVTTYVEKKNEIIDQQRMTIHELNTPVIPLSSSIAVLPIIGTVDSYQGKDIQTRTLQKVEKLRIAKLIVDLSGVSYIDTAVLGHLFKLVDGLKLLGCQTIFTGISSDIASSIVKLGVKVNEKVEIEGTLEAALERFY